MKINNNKKNIFIKKIIVTSLSIVLACGLLFFASEKFGLTNFIGKSINGSITTQNTEQKIDYSAPTDEQKQSGENIKSLNSQTPLNNDLGVSISSATMVGDTFKVRIIISGFLSNNGTCDIKLTQKDKLYESSVGTFAMNSYSTCQGFNIDKSDLGSGDWNLDTSVTIGDKTSSISQLITLE